MINSLLKDSHITHTRSSIKQQYYNSSTNKQRSNISAQTQLIKIQKKEPANTISFSGLFSAKNAEKLFDHKLSRDVESFFAIKNIGEEGKEIKEYFLKNLLASAKQFVINEQGVPATETKEVHKSTKNLIEKVVDYLQDSSEKKVEDNAVKAFLENTNNKETATTLLEKIKNETKADIKKDTSKIKMTSKEELAKLPKGKARAIKNAEAKAKRQKRVEVELDVNHPEYKEFVKGKINEAVDILHYVEKPGFLTSERFKKFLKKAEGSQAVFTALLGVAFACLLRPITIVSLPGKKNKDDKKYAAAHSIASGAIGYIFAEIISSPIAKGIGKIANAPAKFMNKPASEKGVIIDYTRYYRNKNDIINKVSFDKAKRFSLAKGYLNQIPEAITAVPKAVMTISLVPVILKYVFGLEKKSHGHDKALPLTENYAMINFSSMEAPRKKAFQHFMGGN